MSDPISSVKDFLSSLKDRLTNPISGTLLVFLIIWNWRTILYLFWGDLTPQLRIELLEKHFIENGIWLWQPVLLTVAYLAAMPTLVLIYDRYLSLTQLKRSRIVLDSERAVNDFARFGDSLHAIACDMKKTLADIRDKSKTLEALLEAIEQTPKGSQAVRELAQLKLHIHNLAPPVQRKLDDLHGILEDRNITLSKQLTKDAAEWERIKRSLKRFIP